MARIFAYCDSPQAGTGFGRSANHVLHALHHEGHTIVQLAVNHDVGTEKRIPWKVYSPSRRDSDPYGLWDIPMVLSNEGPFDILWTSFDPEIPWAYVLPGVKPQMTVLDILRAQKKLLPGFKMAGWFPVDGGPLSGYELGVLTGPDVFDLRATMSTHVHDLVRWTHKLMGNTVNMEALAERLKVVPHGVDIDLYRIATDGEREDAKEILGYPRDTFLIVQVERNQQRKQVWRAMEILERLRLMLPGKPIHLYQHMHTNEETEHARVGWKMDELAWRYGLKPGVDVNWRRGNFTERDMVEKVYAAADVVISTSAGEGFQYPLWEALACGRRVVAPCDSARKAWLQHTPGAHLYKADEHAEVVRGGYNRRMSRPDITDACRIIKKMVEGKEKFREVGESSRSWVERTADVNFVKDWWVREIAALAEKLDAERAEQGFTVHGANARHVISLRAGPGLGDFLMMLPAIQAFVDQHPGEPTTLVLPRNDNHVELGMLWNPCNTLQMEDRVPLDQLGSNIINLSELWVPRHTGGWSDTNIHRTDVVALKLGVDPLTIQKMGPKAAEKHTKQATAHCVQRYGVHPTSCVAICGQSHMKQRSLPEAFILTVAERIINLGLTPILLGGAKMPCARVGILNLTGQTDLGGLIGLLGSVGAAICIDSGPLHIAAIQGTPVVALMPLFDAETRLSYYSGDIEVVRPECDTLLGETYPAGKGGSEAWVSELSPGLILTALQRLIGAEDDSAPKIITAADLAPEDA